MRRSFHNPHGLKAWLCPLVLLLLAGSAGAAATPKSTALVSPGLYPLHTDAAGLELEWIAPPVQTHPAEDGTLEVEVKGRRGAPGCWVWG